MRRSSLLLSREFVTTAKQAQRGKLAWNALCSWLFHRYAALSGNATFILEKASKVEAKSPASLDKRSVSSGWWDVAVSHVAAAVSDRRHQLHSDRYQLPKEYEQLEKVERETNTSAVECEIVSWTVEKWFLVSSEWSALLFFWPPFGFQVNFSSETYRGWRVAVKMSLLEVHWLPALCCCDGLLLLACCRERERERGCCFAFLLLQTASLSVRCEFTRKSRGS